MDDVEVVQAVPAGELDEECSEGWLRLSTEPDLRCVEAVHVDDSTWPWMVTVSVMEFVRSDPLESELRREIATALLAVEGCVRVAEEDREVWIVAGSPQGNALVGAAAAVVDRFRDRTRVHYE